MGESVLSIQSSEKVTSISLPPTPPYHTLEFHLEVLCIIPSGSERPANERLTNGEIRHRPRSYSHPDTPMTAVDQRVRQTVVQTSSESSQLVRESGRREHVPSLLMCRSDSRTTFRSIIIDLLKCSEPVIFNLSLFNFILYYFNSPQSVVDVFVVDVVVSKELVT